MISPLVAVLPVAWLAVYAAVSAGCVARRNVWDRRRETFLVTSLIFAALIFAITEGLSYALLLTPAAMVFSWVVVAVFACLVRLRIGRGTGRSVATDNPRRVQGRVFGALIGCVLLILFVLGVVAAPNSWDAMTYHLPRVMHWLQNASVAHYETSCGRQNMFPPLTEFALTHIIGLAGNDRLAHLVQWYALAASALAASLVARELGAGRRGQLIAAVFAVTLPAAILQSTSPKNDVAAGFMLLTACYYACRLNRAGSAGQRYTPLLFAAAVGLGLATKPTLYLYLPPVCVLAGLVHMRRRGLKRTVAVLVVPTVLSIVVFNGALWTRNIATYGAFMGLPHSTNTTHHPLAVASVALRNLSLHVFSTSIPGNWRVHHAFVLLHQWVGMDIDDPRTTFPFTSFAVNRWPLLHENYAGAPLHLVLIGLAVVLLLRVRRLRGLALAHVLCIAAAALLFCTVVRWQPWHVRLHIGLFFACAPLVGLALQRVARPVWGRVVAAALLLTATPYLFFNQARPILGDNSVFVIPRERQYFANQRDQYSRYRAAADAIQDLQARRVGLRFAGDTYEYPLWVMLHGTSQPAPRIEHLPMRLADAPATVDVVFCPIDSKAEVLRESGWHPLSADGDRATSCLYLPRDAVTPATARSRGWQGSPTLATGRE